MIDIVDELAEDSKNCISDPFSCTARVRVLVSAKAEIERLRVALRTSLEALDRADRGQQSTIVSIHNYYLPNGRQRRM